MSEGLCMRSSNGDELAQEKANGIVILVIGLDLKVEDTSICNRLSRGVEAEVRPYFVHVKIPVKNQRPRRQVLRVICRYSGSFHVHTSVCEVEG